MEKYADKVVTIENEFHQLQEFKIRVYEDHIKLLRFLSDDIECVLVPSEIDSLPVTVIGKGCFYFCENMQHISIPEGMVKIGDGAFQLCTNLRELILPDSIVEIGIWAFRDCNRLKKVKFPRNLKVISEGLFSFCYLWNPEIVFPEELEEIKECAFFSGGLYDLKIPASVKKIGRAAFCHLAPNPITDLPYDKSWFSTRPYGVSVISEDKIGKITEVYTLENNCELHEVTIGSEVKQFFYPCDYIEGRIAYTDDPDNKEFQDELQEIMENDQKKTDVYKVRAAWLDGFVGSCR